ncbi:hypothetical protein PVAND_016491 [Polypedilum vanderplanki]|uniref:Farnesoic acid O-methyl transferase domain-containing protein n=1 Tax=Polypedilum vanderplanki TaxID=319348 RepID=A0A9J6BF83_POLVA|nr:hypothetical protein PVAND_016491 [Polypedilum vanderplanki]
MKFAVGIFILSLFGSSFAQSIDCVYSTTVINNVQHYACNLEIENPNGFDEFQEIIGTHLEGRTNADVTYISHYHGSTTIVPQIICSQFPNLEIIDFDGFGVRTLTDTSFGGCRNARSINLFTNQISEISENAFANNPNLTFIDLSGNQLRTLHVNLFVNQQQLDMLELNNNSFTENFPAGLFRNLVNLRMLLLNECRLTAINPNWFTNLGNLFMLNMFRNEILEINEDAFVGLENLNILNLNHNFIQTIHPNAFSSLGNLRVIYMEDNQISELPIGVFAPFTAISYVDLRLNRIKTVNRDIFGSLSALGTLDLDFNVVNAMDERIFREADALYLFYFGNNLCASGFFNNFVGNRDFYIGRLSRCFRNFEFTVEITTESDNPNYQFFSGPAPGIQLRVMTANEVHIALTPFNFPWTPMIEIIIGAANNTRSIVRRNQETDVAVVPTPGILNENFWNGFRITWANHIVLIFREGDQFPFLAFTMMDFFNVNFYGLRTPENRASWVIQPVDADEIGVSPAALSN